MLPDFLACQLTTHVISLRCSLTVTGAVSSLLSEPPSKVFHHDTASARLPATSALPVLCRSPPPQSLVSGRFRPANIGTTTKLIKENSVCSTRVPFRDGAEGLLEQS